jgi:ornithine carbamoyltransferase
MARSRSQERIASIARRERNVDGPQSAVWQQAANRLPTEQALIYALITGNWED